MKVLLAVDGSDYTRRALDYLASHAWLRSGNPLTAFTVVLPVPHRAAAFVPSQVVQNYYRDDAEQVLRPVRERLAGADAEVDSDYAVGRRAEAIAHKATSGGYELVVMGSHGHGALDNVVLGSVATRVLALCSTPVLLIR